MDRIINFLNRTWMDVTIYNGTDGTEKVAELSFYSPAGENVIETVMYDGTEGDFIREFERFADGWDAEAHCEILIPYRGTNGVPNSIRDLMTDADSIKEYLVEVAGTLREVIE